jgi:bifunctional UDP-N-acetylglucosamine pyrophosphorylase/glucosamine-1-phosphate N-acetyltransferase
MRADELHVVVLAAGEGKRMKSALPKVLQPLAGRPMLAHVIEAARSRAPSRIHVVHGHGGAQVQAAFADAPDLAWALQDRQLGTGHAVLQALPAIPDAAQVLVLFGDVPLILPATLERLLAAAGESRFALLAEHVADPRGYGRVLRDGLGRVRGIVEEKDATPEQRAVNLINTGVLTAAAGDLKRWLARVGNRNAQGEYYLTDIVEKAAKEGQTVAAFPLGNPEEAAGVNSPTDMHYVNDVLKRRHVAHLRESGVLFDSPDTCTIDASVTVEPGAHIGPNVQLRGKSSVGAGAIIEGTTLIIDSQISPGALIKLGSRVEGASIGELSTVGPFANVRPGTVLGKEVRIGNFVETKNTTMRDGAKASHLTYLGDCTVGEHANIGAGTITCNYDGYNKAEITIGKGAFIGSNTALVAPVTVGDGAIVAAGSVITRDVPKDALGVARARQENKDGWAKARREQLETAKKK